MRWPFRSKNSTEPGGTPSITDAPAELQYAESVPRMEWSTLPPAPIAISLHAPRTIVGRTSAIRRPIGFREAGDVIDDGAVGVVAGLVAIAPSAPRLIARRDAPIGEPSALPDVAGRVLRTVEGNGRVVLTTSDSVIVTRAVESAPTNPPPAQDRPLATTAVDDDALPHAPRSSLARSRRMGLGPGYHGPLPDAIRRDRLDRVPSADDADESTERVPDDVRTIIRDAYGHDVGDQVVRRGPEVTEEARQLGAQAFARDGEVFVPIEAGPLDRAAAKSLLAHELTHLVQQRGRGAPLPADGSPEALALEAEAQRAERFVRGDPGAPSPGMITAPTDDVARPELAETQRFVNELVHRGVAEPDGTGGIRFLWGHGAGSRVQRATEPAGAAAHQENWNVAANVAHALGETIAGEFEDMIAGEFSFVTGLEDEITAAHDVREREFRREQTKDAFARLRLEHLRVNKRKEIGGAELSETQEKELARQRDDELKARTDALVARVNAQLEQMNEQLRHADQPVRKEIDPDRYDEIFNQLFGDPEGELPPDDQQDKLKEHADKAVAKAKAETAARAVTAAKAAGPGTTGPTPAGGPPTPGAPGAGGGAGSTIDSGSALWGALVTDLAVLEAGEFGITLTPEEMKGIYTPAVAAPATPAKSADPTPTPWVPAPGSAPSAPGEGAGDTKHIGPSGHEKIDLDRIDFEELSKRLFPRLRSSLRQELMVDRERSGRLNHH